VRAHERAGGDPNPNPNPNPNPHPNPNSDPNPKQVDASERTRLGSGARCRLAPLEEHAFFTSEPAWEWEALSAGRLAPPPLPWDKVCPSF